MKKLIAILFVAMMAFATVSCNKDEKPAEKVEEGKDVKDKAAKDVKDAKDAVKDAIKK